jgi:tRNA modification GTPase
MNDIYQQEPICALATASGVGAIAVIRVSGQHTLPIVNQIFRGKDLTKVASHTIHFGTIREGEVVVDEVLMAVFKSPTSFTKEDVVEISCHGSDFIIRQILKLLVKAGARMAQPGEFTQRAFLNGQLDLVQAEAVADLIASDSEANHRTAMNQLRGGFSKKLASMIELELDFGEEDVEFAQRDDLKALIYNLHQNIAPLISSFDYGNAIKEGIPVAIIGAPNVGKSTLLNALLNEEKAIVTAIAGTTRDVIEDVMVIGGTKFRIIDTAGIRETNDLVESIGIERSRQAIEKADIVLMICSPLSSDGEVLEIEIDTPSSKIVRILNKVDLLNETALKKIQKDNRYLLISAKTGDGIDELKQQLATISSIQHPTSNIAANLRHYEHLVKTSEALNDVLQGLESGITGDFLAQDIRLALHHLGEITGVIVTDDLLANIFGKFCIGK